jgi:hypothetical protein
MSDTATIDPNLITIEELIQRLKMAKEGAKKQRIRAEAFMEMLESRAD